VIVSDYFLFQFLKLQNTTMSVDVGMTGSREGMTNNAIEIALALMHNFIKS
jgi:hypothetical protein